MSFGLLNLRMLRSLYNRSRAGGSNVVPKKINLTPETVGMIGGVVPFGKGKYGSAFIELSIRMMASLLSSGEDLQDISKELKVLSTSPYLIGNLERLLKILTE